MIHYLLKDFQGMLSGQKLLVILLCFIQVVSSIIIFFAYGVINHYNTQIGVTEGTELGYTVQQVDMEEYFTYEEVQAFHKIILERYKYKLEDYVTFSIYYLDGREDENGKIESMIATSAKYINDKYTVGSERFLNRAGLNFLDKNAYVYNKKEYIVEQFDKGERVAVVGSAVAYGEEYITLYGEKYRVIGVMKEFLDTCLYIPHSHMPKEGKYRNVGFTLSKPLLKTEYEELEEIVESCFDGKGCIPEEFNGIKNENQYRVYKSIIAILAIFVLMSGINYCIIFSHILDKRRRMLAVSRICGCTGIKTVVMYMIEIMSVSLITLGAGMLIFIYGILPNIKSTFEYIEYYLNTKVYIQLALGYVGILVVIYLGLVLRFARKTPVRLMKEV